jgi:hypothetical protein
MKITSFDILIKKLHDAYNKKSGHILRNIKCIANKYHVLYFLFL